MQAVGTAGGEQGDKQRMIGETMAWEIWKERYRALKNRKQPKLEAIIRTTTRLAEETWRTGCRRADVVTARSPKYTCVKDTNFRYNQNKY